jgi:hypothetical protein
VEEGALGLSENVVGEMLRRLPLHPIRYLNKELGYGLARFAQDIRRLAHPLHVLCTLERKRAAVEIIASM